MHEISSAWGSSAVQFLPLLIFSTGQIEASCGKEKLTEDWEQFINDLSERRRQFDSTLDEELATARKQLEELKS